MPGTQWLKHTGQPSSSGKNPSRTSSQPRQRSNKGDVCHVSTSCHAANVLAATSAKFIGAGRVRRKPPPRRR